MTSCYLSGIGLYNIKFSNYNVLQRSDMKKENITKFNSWINETVFLTIQIKFWAYRDNKCIKWKWRFWIDWIAGFIIEKTKEVYTSLKF